MKSTNTLGLRFIARPANSPGQLHIYVRITVKKRRVEISLQKTVARSHWDAKIGCACCNRDVMRKINSYIEEVRSKLMECYSELQLKHRPLTCHTLKALFLGEEQPEHTLCSLITYHNTNMKEVLSPGTLKNYFTTEKYLKLFLQKKHNRKDIYLSELNYQFISEFEFFLRKSAPLQAKNPLANNGIMKHMERLRKLVTLAAKMDWISKDPFVQYSLRFQKVDKAFLTSPELAIVEKTYLPIHRLNLARDLFVFSCYTGLSYIDLVRLTPSQIYLGIDDEYWLKTTRQKTETQVHVPLLPQAKAVIEKYRNDPRAIIKGLLFPYLTNQILNQYLKEIGKICGVNKVFSCHMARHTFATTVTLTNGVPIETVSKMLGHTKLSTTLIYARVLDKKISEDMLLLRKRLNNQLQ